MNQILIKPEVEQKTIWYIKWWIVFIPCAVLLTLLLAAVRYPESVAILTTLIMFLIAALIVLFWIPPFHKSLLYEIKDDSVVLLKGVFWKIKLIVPISKIANVKIKQGPLQKLFKVATVNIIAAEDEEHRWSYPDIQFVDIKLAEETGNEILKRIKAFKANQTTESKSSNSELSDKEKIKYLMEELESIKKELKDKQ
jgi:membrane protein YdbS with pleckstrin-like domain